MVIEGTHYSPNCSCRNCKRIKIMDKKASPQKESEWESELKELLEKQGVDIMEDGGHQIFDEQVALIIRILSNREKEIAEEVPNALHEYARWILTDGKNAGPLQRRGKKKEITLQILKH